MIALDFTEKGKQIRRASLHKKNQKNIIKKRGSKLARKGTTSHWAQTKSGKHSLEINYDNISNLFFYFRNMDTSNKDIKSRYLFHFMVTLYDFYFR